LLGGDLLGGVTALKFRTLLDILLALRGDDRFPPEYTLPHGVPDAVVGLLEPDIGGVAHGGLLTSLGVFFLPKLVGVALVLRLNLSEQQGRFVLNRLLMLMLLKVGRNLANRAPVGGPVGVPTVVLFQLDVQGTTGLLLVGEPVKGFLALVLGGVTRRHAPLFFTRRLFH